MKPKAIIPDPIIADNDKSEVPVNALTEFRNNSGAADPNATKVTATRTERNKLKVERKYVESTRHFFRDLKLFNKYFNSRD